nr:tumor protein p53-inducible protein 11 isoform X1 [Pongo pygmaeus]
MAVPVDEDCPTHEQFCPGHCSAHSSQPQQEVAMTAPFQRWGNRDSEHKATQQEGICLTEDATGTQLLSASQSPSTGAGTHPSAEAGLEEKMAAKQPPPLMKKHSQTDLVSRLKTRKILGVGGEDDDGEVHRSKISQVLGNEIKFTIREPLGLRVWQFLSAVLFSGIAIMALAFPDQLYDAVFDGAQVTSKTPIRLYGGALLNALAHTPASDEALCWGCAAILWPLVEYTQWVGTCRCHHLQGALISVCTAPGRCGTEMEEAQAQPSRTSQPRGEADQFSVCNTPRTHPIFSQEPLLFEPLLFPL